MRQITALVTFPVTRVGQMRIWQPAWTIPVHTRNMIFLKVFFFLISFRHFLIVCNLWIPLCLLVWFMKFLSETPFKSYIIFGLNHCVRSYRFWKQDRIPSCWWQWKGYKLSKWNKQKTPQGIRRRWTTNTRNSEFAISRMASNYDELLRYCFLSTK